MATGEKDKQRFQFVGCGNGLGRVQYLPFRGTIFPWLNRLTIRSNYCMGDSFLDMLHFRVRCITAKDRERAVNGQFVAGSLKQQQQSAPEPL